MSEAVVAMLRDVGIDARLEIIDGALRVQKIRQKSFKGLRWATPASPLADPDGLLWRLAAPGGTFDTWRHPRFVSSAWPRATASTRLSGTRPTVR